ncbi:hypothetical protein PIB30_053923 [Stylosanthes scabra]|uniref:Alpha/beta hydrolase fold-3 domain-containing protein n=1 Tax=Stylosanthes scabra TaxID=79078 RepID=A0ABU6QJF1_9FABA|nr:hypothetical protein [Stylosanthes scabra]
MSSPPSSLITPAMDPTSTEEELVLDISPFLKTYKDGRIHRLMGCDVVPPSLDPTTNVESKDIVISETEDISARIFIPKSKTQQNHKLPVLVYFHGGGFCIETPFSPHYHNFLNAVASEAGVVGVSVHYRRAPEHPLPVAHEDSWASLKWVASHTYGNGPEEWLNRYADLDRVFLAGDSAGANIAHHMGVRVGTQGVPGLKVEGIALVHSFFWGEERIGSEASKGNGSLALVEKMWKFVCPTTIGLDDPLINPEKDPNLGKMGCQRVVVFVAENDLLADRGWYYKECLEKSGWGGVVEVVEAKGEGHVFHLFNPKSENALSFLSRFISFINHT